MIIAGAGGHAREIIDLLPSADLANSILFDDFSKDIPAAIMGISIISDIAKLNPFINEDNRLVLGTGNGLLRESFKKKLEFIGAKLYTVKSTFSQISNYNVVIGAGVNIMTYVLISNNVTIGEGALINARANIHHDVSVGKFSEISPGVLLLGGVVIGDFSFIGAGAIIFPKVKIGNNCTIGAGSVVTKDVADGLKIKGEPAK